MAPSNQNHGFDLERVLEETGLDREEYLEIYDLFKENFAELMEELEAAVANNESNMVRQASHTIKGVCSNIGFMDLANIAKTIQENPDDLKLAAASIPEMRAICAERDKQIQDLANMPA
jgi:HPt (histidine-containing phosphotransfer) domain-containing protein